MGSVDLTGFIGACWAFALFGCLAAFSSGSTLAGAFAMALIIGPVIWINR